MTLKTLALLLEMIAGIQRDLGLEDALPLERDIMAVVGMLIEDGHDHVRTEMLTSHPLLADVPKASLHRALRSLMRRGLLRHADGYKTGRFVLARKL